MTAEHPQPADVSVIVCTKNSIASIQACLESLRESGVGEIIVVDASSTDGSRRVADSLADIVLEDPGDGLGKARNMGISAARQKFVLNSGSDNIFPPRAIERMLNWLQTSQADGVSAQTQVTSQNFLGRGLNAWRTGRFRPGPALVIGTPTLFHGHLLRANPYDDDRRFSDDSELCERWTRNFGARFEISDAIVIEQGKTTWKEVVTRAHMYGVSDYEVFTSGRIQRWSWYRKLKSLMHPLVVDLLQPLCRLSLRQRLMNAPFLVFFVAMRYHGWLSAAISSDSNQSIVMNK